MDAEQLAAIRARAEAATPGPWNIDFTDDDFNVRPHNACTMRGGDHEGVIVARVEEANNQDDLRFAMYAREDIPALLAVVETWARALVTMQPCRSGNDWECPFCHCREHVTTWHLSAPGTPHTAECPVAHAHSLLGAH